MKKLIDIVIEVDTSLLYTTSNKVDFETIKDVLYYILKDELPVQYTLKSFKARKRGKK